uniref:Early transcribed membrane protein n=1 Tax=Meloidogyne hapla TaxID=6305 RepID=A0A1I8AYJ4_MELHA
MKLLTSKFAPTLVCLFIALFIISEVVNYSEGFPMETSFQNMRRKRAMPKKSKSKNSKSSLSASENIKKKTTKKSGTSEKVENLLNEDISVKKALLLASAGAFVGLGAGIIGGRKVQQNQYENMNQLQYNR